MVGVEPECVTLVMYRLPLKKSWYRGEELNSPDRVNLKTELDLYRKQMNHTRHPPKKDVSLCDTTVLVVKMGKNQRIYLSKWRLFTGI